MLSDISYSDSFKIMTPSFSKVNKILAFIKAMIPAFCQLVK